MRCPITSRVLCTTTKAFVSTCRSISLMRWELCMTHISLKRMGFYSVSRSKDRDLVFSATYLWGSPARLAWAARDGGQVCLLPASGGISPTDKLRKNSALRLGRARRGPPVTSEKSTLFIGVTKIVRFCKALAFYWFCPFFSSWSKIKHIILLSRVRSHLFICFPHA